MSEQTPPPGGPAPAAAGSTDGLTAKKRSPSGARAAIIAAVTVVAVVAVVAVVWATTRSGDDTAASSPEVDAEGYDLDADVVVGLRLEPDNLDIRATAGAALDQILIDNVYQGIVTRGEDGTVVPALASDWEISDDGLTYTFTLDEDVTFHSGNPLSVDDVVWSLTTVWEDETVRGHEELAGVASIEAPDETTVVITLAEPNIEFLWDLTGRAGLVLEEAAENDLAVSANGTGPFLAPEGAWVQGDSIELTRYDDYWGGPAAVASVTFVYYSDETALANALRAGDIHLGQLVEEAPGFVADDTQVTVQTTSSQTGTIAFNSARAPFDDVRVRQALRHAFDKEALWQANNELGELIGGPIPPNDPGYEDLTDLFPYDPERARELLAEAGYPDGIEATLTIPSFYGTTLPDLLTSQYADAGITLTVEPVEFAVWLEDVHTNADYDLSYVLHAEGRDLYNFAGRLSSSPELSAQGERYYVNYENPEVDRLFAESRLATTQEEQAELLREAARIVAEDSPADWTSAAGALLVADGSVEGYSERDLSARFPVTQLRVLSAP